MKASTEKSATTTPTTATQPTQEPFFSKKGGEGFFDSAPQGNAPFIQAKLTINQPGDIYEQEADRVADQVVQRLAMPSSEPATPLLSATGKSPAPVQTKCADCEQEEKLQRKEEEGPEEEIMRKVEPASTGQPAAIQMKCADCEQEEQVQRKEEEGPEEQEDIMRQAESALPAAPSDEAGSDFSTRLQSSKGGGSPLPENTRTDMESALGTDLSGVRIHTGSEAAGMSKSINAQAFTHGSDVYFNDGKFDAGSTDGKRLLAHELVHVGQQKSGREVQLKPVQNTSAVEDGGTLEKVDHYVVKGQDADKHKGELPYAIDSGTVAQGEVVELIEKSKDNKYAKVTLSDASTTWLALSDLQLITKVTSDDEYTVSYNDVFVYKDPVGKTTGSGKDAKTTFDKKTKVENNKTVNETVAENVKVKVTDRYKKFVHIKGTDAGQTEYGWIYEGDLLSQAKVDRKTYLDAYKTWLEGRLVETKALDTKQMIDHAKAFLGEIEKTCVLVNASTPTYPKIDEMSKTPTFSEGASRSFAPPELIGVTRQFIVLLESTAPTPKEAQNAVTSSDASIAGGSLYDDIDWNKRLGVPQYRTQSDNLLSPEATCMPTAYAMILERLGLNRKDILDAIDANLKKNNKTFDAMAKDYFEKEESVRKAKDNNAKRDKMLKENNDAKGKKLPPPHKPEDIPAKMDVPEQPNEGEDYQRLRGTDGGMIGKEDALSKKFKEQGQSDDLLGFLGFLMGYKQRQEIGLGTINTIDNNSESEFTEEIIYGWSGKARGKMKETLDAGGAILLGISHKSGVTGGHVITVQQVTNTGLIVDDPYGGGNTDYRWTNKKKESDFYAPNQSAKRSSAYKNKQHFTPKASLDDQDFWLNPGQNLTSDESLGNSKLIPYEILDHDDSFINYIKLYSRPKAK